MGYGTVLLVEDDPDDVELTLEAFRAHNLINEIIVTEDGEQAIEYLFAKGQYADRDARDIPNLIMLDLNLPKIDGLEVLNIIRKDPRTKAIPVVIMTSSDELNDMILAGTMNIVEYIQKPINFSDFFSRAATLGMSWILHGYSGKRARKIA